MMIIPGISTRRRVTVNVGPSDVSSNKNIGILVVDQAPIKIRIFLKETPFFMKTAATGKAPYSGPAAAEPMNMASIMPFRPEP